ncbi:MAG: helix-turn-helix domain-containing protein [Rhizomicrobium sp.]
MTRSCVCGRFEDFEKSLKIARRVLSERLALLVEHGILKKVAYQERPTRHEYRLTDKGTELYPALISIVHWGDKHYATKAGPPVLTSILHVATTSAR